MMNFHWFFVTAGTRVRRRRAGGGAPVFSGFVGVERFSVGSGFFSEHSGFFSLPFLSKLVGVELFLVNGYDLNVSAADEHAVFALDHFCELGGYLNNCLPRKFPMLKYQT